MLIDAMMSMFITPLSFAAMPPLSRQSCCSLRQRAATDATTLRHVSLLMLLCRYRRYMRSLIASFYAADDARYAAGRHYFIYRRHATIIMPPSHLSPRLIFCLL